MKAILTLALASVLLHVPSAPQTRDTPVAPVGSASISGVVVTDDPDARPIHRATVTLSTGLSALPQSVVTDETGRFVFTGVPPGNYTLLAAKSAYVPTFYGAKRVGSGPGVPIAIVDGQQVTALVLRMPHGAVLTGTLRFSNGRPASGANLQVTPVDLVNGRRRPRMEIQTATTDDRGVYRVYGLAAGDYVIMARAGFTTFGPFGGSNADQVSQDEVRWAERMTASPGSAPPIALTPPPPPGQSVAYAPVYFPGSSDPSDAVLVTLAKGEERGGLDFVLSTVPTATLSGQVFDPDGGVSSDATVSLAPIETQALDVIGTALARLMPGPSSHDGTFTLSGVVPGRYRLTARAAPTSATKPADAGLLQMARAMIGGPGADATLWGEEEVTVDGHDISGLSIHLKAGLSVSGKVVFETASPTNTSQVHILVSTPPAGSSPVELVQTLVAGGSASVEADGSFIVKGLMADRYRLGMTTGGLGSLIQMFQPGVVDPTPGTIFLKSAIWQGHDIADIPFDLKAGTDLSGVVVTITDRPTVLRGTVKDAAGRPTPRYPILVFATDRQSWFAGSRRIQSAHVATDGTFTITGLPAGEYYIAALTDLNANETYDPAFLESTTGAAIRVTLADGERKTQDLKLAGG